MTIGSANKARRLRPDAQAARWLRAVCAGALPEDWPPEPGDPVAALHLARVHHLAARAGSRLADSGGCGEELRAPLVRAWRQALGDEALYGQALEQIGRRAAEAGLPVIALKGVDLARRFYRPGERTSNDVDLLVPRSRLGEAEKLLGELGFRCDHPDPGAARRHWFALTFRDPRRPRVQVDLHWALGPPSRVRWNLPELFGRAGALKGLDGILCLERHDLLAHLALHAVAFHGATGRWIWWLDLREVCRAADPSLAWARARECGGSVALGAALRRASSLFGPIGGAWARAGGRAGLIDSLAEAADGRPLERPLRWTIAALAIDRPLDALRASMRAVWREWGGGDS